MALLTSPFKPKAAPKAVTAAQFHPSPPRADLLPTSWRLKDAARVARLRAGAMVAGAVLCVGGVYGFGLLQSHTLDVQIDAANARSDDLADELARYAPVTNLAVKTDQLTTTVHEQTSTAIDHSQVLARFLAAVSSAMTPTTVQVSTGADVSCPSADPFDKRPTAGCVNFSGIALDAGGAAQTVAALATDEWFIDAFVPNVGTNNAGETTLSGSVALSPDAYTNPQDGEQDGSVSK